MKKFYMDDGFEKTTFMKSIKHWTTEAGIYFLLTNHVDKTNSIDFLSDRFEKEFQYSKIKEKPKGVGSEYKKILNLMLEIRNSSILNGSNYYPSELDKFRKIIDTVNSKIKVETIE